MGEHTVQVPLWSEVGLMYAGPESLVETENRYHFVYQP
jgi:hypothetical protein